MRYSYAAVSMIFVGMLAFVILMVFQDITVNNEADYYSIKEAMEASMVESIDKSYYARTGELKIVEQKFVANFTRRFANGTMGNSNNYVIDFYDIMESPPKASVVIRNNTDLMVISKNSTDIVNSLTSILEATVDRSSYDNKVCNGNIKTNSISVDGYYSNLAKGDSTSYRLKVANVKSMIDKDNIFNLRISEIKDVKAIKGSVDKIRYDNTYVSYRANGSWNSVPTGEQKKTGYEENNCYVSNVEVRIKDATGQENDGYPVVGVKTLTTDVSVSGCNDSNRATLIKYTVVWKYDYCG